MQFEDELDFARILDPTSSDALAARQIQEYCKINIQHIEVALERHAALYAYAAACFEMAEVQETQKEYALEQAKSTAFAILSDQAREKNPGAKVVVAEIERQMPSVPSIDTATKAVHTAMVVKGRMKALCKGLEHRKDMLVQIASKQRAELR